MKRLITMVIIVLAVAVAMAQAPEKFTYQAVVRNASNALVANTLVGVRVSILQGGPAAVRCIWRPRRPPQTSTVW